jgi:serine/threonine protein kinase
MPTRQLNRALDSADESPMLESIYPGKPINTIPRLTGYEILGELGRGGMGVVYKARQVNLDRIVAIKSVLLREDGQRESVARFEKEAVAVAKLRHPNIVTAFDFGKTGDSLYFVMELLEGEDLDQRLMREGAMSEIFTWGLIRQAAAGLAHASLAGLVHRDIKPGNLFLCPAPEGFSLPRGMPLVKVTDFGLVFSDAEQGAANRLTNADTVLGTPVYMAPEQFSRDVDHRADIYALGITACQMLLGHCPYEGLSIWEIMTAKIESKEPILPSNASAGTIQLIREMTASNAAQRLGDYQKLLERIDVLLTQIGSPSGSQGPTTLPDSSTAPYISQTSQSTVRVAKAPGGISRRVWMTGVGVVLAITLPILLLSLLQPLFTTRPEATLTPQGPTLPLFSGEGLNGWTPLSGQWSVGDDGGATVLVGQGVARRMLPESTPEHYRLTVQVSLKRAQSVEVHFGLPPEEQGQRKVVRVLPESAQLVTRRGDRGEWQSLARAVPLEVKSEYLEIRIERQPTHWFAYVGEQLLGTVRVSNPERREIRLAIEGEALFEAVDLQKLGETP